MAQEDGQGKISASSNETTILASATYLDENIPERPKVNHEI